MVIGALISLLLCLHGCGADPAQCSVIDQRTTEPETGVTLQDFDAAGNLGWRASALPWTYAYNNRRIKTSEHLYMPSAGVSVAAYDWIDPYGHVASTTYPFDNRTVAFSPDALGRPRSITAGGVSVASAIVHHPNGAVGSYNLANGIAYSMQQNTRGLPQVWRHSGVVQDVYTYDAVGNVTYILDQQEGGQTNRFLGYDGLDRLTTAISNVWWGGSYTYDALDNLRTSTVGSRTLTYNIDPATNRLYGWSGSQNIGLSYDANGNITQRGNYSFSFDIGNRMRSAPGRATYSYDGHGRRSLVAYADGSWKLQFYSQAGKLLWSRHSSTGNTDHIYLGGKAIAEIEGLSNIRYLHTDALGSPVARTNSAGAVIDRTRYEPYGATAAGTEPPGLGFTGHVNDANTGLVYMQQRYYEPLAGRFLSVDPVVTNAATADSFNRYLYGNNNPFKYTDPDGRFAWLIPIIVEWVLPAAIVTAGAWGIANSQGNTSSSSNSGREESASSHQASHTSQAVSAGGAAPPPQDGGGGGRKSGDKKGKDDQIAPERTAKDIGKRVERDLGPDARRQLHDEKIRGNGDRTLGQLKEDARALYTSAGKEIPSWLK